MQVAGRVRDDNRRHLRTPLLFTHFLLNKIVCSKWLRNKIEIALPLPAKMERPHCVTNSNEPLQGLHVHRNRSNRPRSIYQYSNMGPRLSGLTSIFGVVFFVSKSPVGIERQKKLEKFAIFTRKPRSHA